MEVGDCAGSRAITRFGVTQDAAREIFFLSPGRDFYNGHVLTRSVEGGQVSSRPIIQIPTENGKLESSSTKEPSTKENKI